MICAMPLTPPLASCIQSHEIRCDASADQLSERLKILGSVAPVKRHLYPRRLSGVSVSGRDAWWLLEKSGAEAALNSRDVHIPGYVAISRKARPSNLGTAKSSWLSNGVPLGSSGRRKTKWDGSESAFRAVAENRLGKNSLV